MNLEPRTSNLEPRTPDAFVGKVVRRRSEFGVRCSMFDVFPPRFMRPMRGKKAWELPMNLPSPPRGAGERVAEGRVRGRRFMAAIQVQSRTSRASRKREGRRFI